MQVENPPKNLTQKEKAQWSISWVGLPETEMSIEPIIPQNCLLFLIKKLCLWNIYSKILINR